ncbi:hypothetical protein L21SP2_2380 [Salinispira pacifica]|uniref:Uncharacterized protein n=1 Tax=Salinispira pacifica TaxID=1307761 RepID=V5WIW2_9SPIO|nr:hypothetical protein L21SP2_2380 [Salinispira pacifica]
MNCGPSSAGGLASDPDMTEMCRSRTVPPWAISISRKKISGRIQNTIQEETV